MSNSEPIAMNLRIRYAVLNGVISLLLLGSGIALAADKPGDPKRLQQQLRAAEREKSQLTAKKAELEGQLKTSQDALTEAKGKQDAAIRHNAALARKLETTNTEKAELQTRLASTEQALESEMKKLADTESRLLSAQRESEERRRAFAEEKLRLDTALKDSRERNERMYKLGFELIDRYERAASVWTEPVTGLRRAQIEKMAEQDRDKFDKDRLPFELSAPRQER